MPLVHLIRHGEPVVRGLLLGCTDAPLGAAAIPPSSIAVASLFASPLQRAYRTAELLFPGVPMTLMAALKERDLGDWDGLKWDAVEQDWPKLASRAAYDWLGTTPPNGEAWPRFVERVAGAWQVIRTAPSPIVIVAHAGVNAALADCIAGQKPLEFRQDYLEVLTFEFAN